MRLRVGDTAQGVQPAWWFLRYDARGGGDVFCAVTESEGAKGGFGDGRDEVGGDEVGGGGEVVEWNAVEVAEFGTPIVAEVCYLVSG